MLVQELGHSHSLFDAGGIGGLGRQMVVDAHHGSAGVGCQQTAHAVMRVDAAHHEAAAVHVHDHRQLFGLDGVVVADLELAHGTLEELVGHLGHRRRLLVPVRTLLDVVGAHLLETGIGVERVARNLLRLDENGLHLVVHELVQVEFVVHDATPHSCAAATNPLAF